MFDSFWIEPKKKTKKLKKSKGLNEDGSFIGQYGRKGQETNSQAFATLV